MSAMMKGDTRRETADTRCFDGADAIAYMIRRDMLRAYASDVTLTRVTRY